MTATDFRLRLAGVRTMTVTADDGAGRVMRGAGTVEVVWADPDVVEFHERGAWQDGPRATFRNVYRWSREPGDVGIRLEHLRFGRTRPVALVRLMPDGPDWWRAAAPHVCGDDRYDAEVAFPETGLALRWVITGPRKAQIVEARYT